MDGALRAGRNGLSERGSVLLATVFVVVAVAGLLLAFTQIGVSFTREHTTKRADDQALALADSGLAESLVAMRRGGTGRVGTAATPALYGDGVFWTAATDIGNAVRLVHSAAMYESGRVALEMIVFHYSTNPFDVAIFSDDTLTMASNVQVDSYDPANGTYQDQLDASGTGYVDDGAVVMSNSDIDLAANTDIYGDVHAGHDSELIQSGTADVSGITEPMVADRELPPVVVPTTYPASGDLLVNTPGAMLASGDYSFTSLTVTNGSSLTIQGPANIVIDEWTLWSNSDLILDTAAGPITFYVTGTTDLRSNSDIITTGTSATEVTLNFAGGPGQSVSIDSNSDFHGVIYAPEADIEISSNFELFGAIIAGHLTLNSNVQIHFDESLAITSPEDEIYISGRVSQAKFPVEEFLANRRSPFTLLGLAPGDLPTPEAAHDN